MTDRQKLLLALVGALLPCAAVWLGTITGTLNIPVVIALFTLGPFAIVLLLIPAVAYPLLVVTCPLTRPKLKRAVLVAAVPLVASGLYLWSASGRYGGKEASIVVLSAVSLLLGVLLCLAMLRESRFITLVFHAVLVAWLSGFSFPYLGEMP
jgi:hypothetical protein